MTAADDRQRHRKGGRPRKDNHERRSELISARVRQDELAAIEERAASCNRELSDFLREQAIHGGIEVRRFQSLSQIDRHDLARIGSNLNQIARVLNTTGEVRRAAAIEELLDELRELLRHIDQFGLISDELGER